MGTERHAVWIVGFSRTNAEWEAEYERSHPREGLTTMEYAKAKLVAAEAAGAKERGSYADCSTAIGGCGWRGPDRATEEEAREDAREHDAESYEERERRTAEAGEKRAAERARRANAADRQPYHEETIERLYDEVVAADRAWEADLSNKELAKAYRSAKARFRAAEKAAIADDFTYPCGRCGGTGHVPPWGVCFRCGGGKREAYRPQKFQADPATRAKRDAKAVAKQAAEDDAYAKALAALPADVRAALVAADEKLREREDRDELSREENFRADLAGKLRKYGSLSEKQVAAVERGLANDQKRADEKEALKDAPPLEAGRRVVEGEVVSTKTVETNFGSALKILVRQDDGNKVWGTVPRAIEDATFSNQFYDETGKWVEEPTALSVLRGAPEFGHSELRGARVRFTAAVERSKDDPHFGFFKRPTKAEIIG